MTILLFLFGVAVAAGLFFILADILKLPRLSTEKALLSAGRTEKKADEVAGRPLPWLGYQALQVYPNG